MVEERIGAVAAMAGRSVLVQRTDPAGPARRNGRPRVVAAVRDLGTDHAVLVEAAEAATELDASLVLAHGVPLSFGERSVGLADALDRGRRLLSEAADRVTSAYPGCTVTTRLLRQRPHELVGEELDADLLVLGGSRQRIPARLGLVASSALQHAPCPVLLAPRPA
jgi:nucleotide-binding universal stress UspA family protein